MAKPGDFFVGVTDLFSVILPGASLAYVLLQVEEKKCWNFLGLRTLEKTEGYVAFFLISYLLGHLIDMTGGFILDWLYDRTYSPWMRKKRRRAEKGENGTWDNAWAWKTSGLLATGDVLYESARSIPSAMPAGDSIYQWSRSWIQLKRPAAYVEVERLQANSKFFRGLIVVLVTASALGPQFLGFSTTGRVACVALAMVCFPRYANLRWKAVQQAYRFYIALRLEHKGASRKLRKRAESGEPKEPREPDELEEPDEAEPEEPADE